MATATFTNIGEAIFIDVCTPFTIRNHAGQYISLWIAGLGFRSFFENHPFIVAAAKNCKRENIEVDCANAALLNSPGQAPSVGPK